MHARTTITSWGATTLPNWFSAAIITQHTPKLNNADQVGINFITLAAMLWIRLKKKKEWTEHYVVVREHVVMQVHVCIYHMYVCMYVLMYMSFWKTYKP